MTGVPSWLRSSIRRPLSRRSIADRPTTPDSSMEMSSSLGMSSTYLDSTSPGPVCVAAPPPGLAPAVGPPDRASPTLAWLSSCWYRLIGLPGTCCGAPSGGTEDDGGAPAPAAGAGPAPGTGATGAPGAGAAGPPGAGAADRSRDATAAARSGWAPRWPDAVGSTGAGPAGRCQVSPSGSVPPRVAGAAVAGLGAGVAGGGGASHGAVGTLSL